MIIKRDVYLQKLIVRMHNGMIKVVTGLRRSGKSYLLFNLFKDYLKNQGVEESQILSIELDKRSNKAYRNPDTLENYVTSLIVDQKQFYLFLDEVQMLDDFEEVLNSFIHIPNLDIYVTGSNSKFLSNDILTEFRGRGDEVHVYPLSFMEFMSVYSGDKYEGLAQYMTYGGLPLLLSMKTEEQKIDYLTRLFRETYLKDLEERNKIEKKQEFHDLINLLASAIGSLSNPTRIEATFKSVIRSDISKNTIHQYIEYLKDAFLICEAYRYEVKGRKYIGTPLKYYFEDVGLRNARLNFRQIEETHLMENVIYNELRFRGFQVDVGNVQKRVSTPEGAREKRLLEIDFVANLGSKRYYVQSALSLPTPEKIAQEKASLLEVKDSFKKIIVVKDIVPLHRDEDGITIMNIYDFLLNFNSLDL